jgi:hypothetical protein
MSVLIILNVNKPLEELRQSTKTPKMKATKTLTINMWEQSEANISFCCIRYLS